MKMCKITFIKVLQSNNPMVDTRQVIGYQYVRSENQAKLIVKDFKSKPGFDAKYEVKNIPEDKEQ